MPNSNQSFAGTTLIIPGAYYNDSVAPQNPNPNLATPPLIFIGFGYTKSLTPVTYSTPTALLNAIRGGPAAAFVPFLANGSPTLNGAQQITFIAVGTNTQSSLTLKSGTSGVVTMSSANYGLPSNLLQATVQSASVSGAKLTLYDGYSQQAASVGDNLGYPFQLAYTGAGTGVTYTVTVSGGSATTFATTSPNAGESLSIPLGSGGYSTVTQLVEYLNGSGFYVANTVSATNGALPSSSLDAAAAVALASGTPYTYANVSAILPDVIYWVNNLSNGLATAVSGAFASSPSVALSTLATTPFSGATSVPPTQANYASGFNVALTQAGWTVFADSNTSGVIALGTQHANTASSPANGKWRRFFSGSSVGDSVTAATVQARACNSANVCYVYPGIYAINTTTGVNTLYSGLYAAAAACGMATGNPPATPLTNKPLTGTGVEVNLTTSQIDTLQQAGVMPLWVSPQTGVPTIISDFTTWQNDANPENVFTQQIACRWYLAYASVAALQPYVGTIASTLTETLLYNAVKKALNSLIYGSNNGNGVINSWDPNSLVLTYTGASQLAAITVNVTLVGQNRFITEQVNVQPLNIVISGGSPNPTVTG